MTNEVGSKVKSDGLIGEMAFELRPEEAEGTSPTKMRGKYILCRGNSYCKCSEADELGILRKRKTCTDNHDLQWLDLIILWLYYGTKVLCIQWFYQVITP